MQLLGLTAFAARLPEVGAPPAFAFLLLEVVGASPPTARADARPDDAPAAPRPDNPLGPRTPVCIALAIDASSSMRGSRFALAVQAARDLIDTMGPQDRVAVVTFDRSARVVFGPSPVDDEGRAHARRALDRVATGMGTNLEGGWREASDAMSRLITPGATRRILVLTDGLPSVGERQPEPLRNMVAEGQQRGIETSVVGIGEGIDEKLCALLARGGDGRFHYLRDEGLLGDVIAMEAEGARRLAATDVSLALAFSTRVTGAQVLHKLPCQPDGRTLEVRLGSVTYARARGVLVQVELDDPLGDVVLGVASARGRAAGPRQVGRTMEGYPLGAKTAGDGAPGEREAESERLSLSLGAGRGDDDARRRVGLAVLTLRTLAEIRSAWDAYDARDMAAVARRLGRARDLRAALDRASLLDAAALASLPDVDAIQAAMSGRGVGDEVREIRRTFASWEHNTQVSQVMAVHPRKPDGDGGGDKGGGDKPG